MRNFVYLSALIFILFSCALSPNEQDLSQRSPAVFQCTQLIVKLNQDVKELKVSDILTPEKLKLYGYKLKGSKLYNGDGELLGDLNLKSIDKFYQWGSIQDANEQNANGGILANEMDYILESDPQVYGRGFYVSTNPFDSQAFGDGLTIFKTAGPVLVLNFNKDIKETSAMAKSFSRLGIDAYQGSPTWYSVLTIKHLKVESLQNGVDYGFWTSQMKKSEFLASTSKFIATNKLVNLSPAKLKLVKNQIFKKLRSLKDPLYGGIDNVAQLSSQIEIKNKWAKLIEHVSLEHIYKVLNKIEVVEGNSIAELFSFAEKTSTGRNQVSLDRIDSAKTFSQELGHILGKKAKFRNYDVVMTTEEKSNTQELKLTAQELSVIEANILLSVSNKKVLDLSSTRALVSYAEMPKLLKAAELLPIKKDLQKYLLENYDFLMANPEAVQTKLTYKNLLSEITELYFTKLGREALMKVFHKDVEWVEKEDSALLLYTSFMALHPFEDGNGRAGRLMYEYLTLVMKGQSEKMILFDYNDDLLKIPYMLIKSMKHSIMGQFYINFFNPQSTEDFRVISEKMFKLYKEF